MLLRSRRLVWLWILVPGLGLGELAAHEYFSARAPTPEQWQAARSALLELRRAGELVVVAPHWAEPLARYAFGREAFPLEQVARPDETGFARAIEVSALGRHAPELTGWRELARQTAGPLTLRLVENPHFQPIRWDFVSGLGPERTVVYEQTSSGQYPCPFHPRAEGATGGLHGHVAFPAARFQCPSAPQVFVGVTVIDDQNYRPRRCLWAHPPADGTLVIRFSSVPLGSIIRGYAGLSWFLWRDGGGTPVELEVRIEGQSLGTLVHRDQEGWHSFAFPTNRAGTTGEVEFRVHSERAENRHFCFQADTR